MPKGAKKPKIYIDTNIISQYIEYKVGKNTAINQSINDIFNENGKTLKLITSAYTHKELRYTDKLGVETEKIVRDFLGSGIIEVVSITPSVANIESKIREITGESRNEVKAIDDLTHIACAINNNCEYILTNNIKDFEPVIQKLLTNGDIECNITVLNEYKIKTVLQQILSSQAILFA